MRSPDDPFDTAGLRAAVLDGWARSPARFREDANAEESLALGGYAGRVLVELVANAVDAAIEAGVPPRVRIELRAGSSGRDPAGPGSSRDEPVELRVADNGTGLTATAVAGLASLRASGKRDNATTVGHFGVGFTAVLSVGDRPRVVSVTGSVSFDAERTAAAVVDRGVPGLQRELDLRSGSVPVLRLPWPADDPEPPPPGYRTEVRLAVRPAARADVERALADPRTVDDLFWALADLDELTVGDTVTRRRRDGDGTVSLLTEGADPRRFRLVERSGMVEDAVLADRPVEERARRRWWVRWVHPLPPVAVDDPAAASLSGDPSGPGLPPAADDDWFPAFPDPATDAGPDGPGADWVATTIGAPTPTDEPLSLPAGLVGTFPVDDTRRRLAPGPLTDHLLAAAVDAYVELLALTDPLQRWRLLPTAGFPVGPVDGRLRDGIVSAAAQAPLLLTAAGDEVTADRACLLPGITARAATLLAEALPGLLAPPPVAAVAALRALGVRTTDLSATSGALAGIDRPADFWGELYRELDAGDRPDPEALADLPVPVLGPAGRPRRAFGPRGLLLPPVDATDEELSALRRLADVVPGLRVVDPDAAAPLLERLGARPATPSAVLADPAVAAAVRRVADDPDEAIEIPGEPGALGSPLTRAVLDLVAAGAAVPGPLVGTLPLVDADGEPARADELHLPGSPLATVVHPDDLAPLHPRWSQDYPRGVLAAVGVRDGFVVVELADPTRDEIPGGAELPDLDEWLDRQVGPPPAITAVLDLDLIDEDHWPQALALLAADPAVRAAVRPGPDGPSYPGWWLGEFAAIDDVPLSGFRLATAADLDGLYEALPIGLDPEFARGCGVLPDLDAAVRNPQELLDRLADPDRRVDPGRVRPAVGALVARLLGDQRRVTDDGRPDLPPLRMPAGVRTLAGTVVDADDAVVLDEPWWAQVLSPAVLVPGGRDPRRTAEAWDLPTASEEYRATVAPLEDPAVPQDPDADARLVRAGAAVGLQAGDLTGIIRQPGLAVSVDGGPAAEVRWWGEGGVGGRLWVDGSAAAAGRAAAWRAGRWVDRQTAVAAADESPLALLESAID